MKIAILIDTLTGGGAERVAVTLANTFAIAGYSVTIFNFQINKPAYKISENIKIVPICENDCCRIRRIYLRLIKLRNILNKEKPEVLLAFLTKNIPYAVMASWRTGVKVIGLERTNPKVHSFVLQFVIRWISPLCDGYIFQTEGAKEYYPRRLQAKSAIILNPVNICNFVADTCEVNHEFRICSVGRLHPAKDFETLLKAFAIYRKKYKGHLDIYGEGEKRNELERLANELGIYNDVHFLGFVENIQKQLCNYDLFVFSSKAEGLPNALIEAMALGLPCISTDCDFGPRELIISGNNGLLVPVGNENRMAEAILWMHEHPQERQNMAKQAIKIREDCSADAIGKKFTEYIVKVVNNDL